MDGHQNVRDRKFCVRLRSLLNRVMKRGLDWIASRRRLVERVKNKRLRGLNLNEAKYLVSSIYKTRPRR